MSKPKGEPHYSQGPITAKPCPNATMDFAPPREDLTSGSVNLITNEVFCIIIFDYTIYIRIITVIFIKIRSGW